MLWRGWSHNGSGQRVIGTANGGKDMLNFAWHILNWIDEWVVIHWVYAWHMNWNAATSKVGLDAMQTFQRKQKVSMQAMKKVWLSKSAKTNGLIRNCLEVRGSCRTDVSVRTHSSYVSSLTGSNQYHRGRRTTREHWANARMCADLLILHTP